MNFNFTYITRFKAWYETRNTRERLLVFFLGWSFLYAFFTFLFFYPIENKETTLQEEIKKINSTIESLQNQNKALDTIMKSSLSKEWKKNRSVFDKLKKQYNLLLKSTPTQQWVDAIRTLLQTQTNINLVEIKNFPEMPFKPDYIKGEELKIYRQQLSLVVLSNYFETLNYIQKLEKSLVNLHWDTLSYTVEQYPIARVELELSVFYEKK